MRLWSKSEVATVKTNYSMMAKSELLSMLPSRSWKSIQHRASALELKRIVRSPNQGMPSRVRTMSDLECAYIACAIDTEGSIFVSWRAYKKGGSKNYPKAVISVTNNNLKWLGHLQRLMGTGIISKHRPSNLTRKQCYILTIVRKSEVGDILIQIRQYLRIKQNKADEALPYTSHRSEIPA